MEIKEEISAVTIKLRNTSFSERTNEEKINDFLDAILKLKKYLKHNTSELNGINGDLERLTWYSNLDNESLKLISELIAVARDLHFILIRRFIIFDKLMKKGIAGEELIEFKHSIDNFKESFEDLDAVFFHLPAIDGFNEVTKTLSEI